MRSNATKPQRRSRLRIELKGKWAVQGGNKPRFPGKPVTFADAAQIPAQSIDMAKLMAALSSLAEEQQRAIAEALTAILNGSDAGASKPSGV
ncbi:MAG TPA: hypothetical protein VH518_21050 [Tepidisphaeraceae bacterium]|jgi:hypothetical protein